MISICNRINKNKINRLHISDPWLKYIEERKKLVEGRKGHEDKYKDWNGNLAIFFNDRTELLVKVKDVRHYDTLYDYLKNEGLEKVAPHICDDYNKVVDAYHEFASDEEILKVGGFNGIEIEVIKVL